MKKIILLFLIFFVISCSENEPKVVIKNYVVDSVWVKQPLSTLDFNIYYYYKTKTNEVFVIRNRKLYDVGDTVKIYE